MRWHDQAAHAVGEYAKAYEAAREADDADAEDLARDMEGNEVEAGARDMEGKDMEQQSEVSSSSSV